MRVLITTPIFPPETRGPATYTSELVSRLVGKQVSARVITFTQNPIKVKDVPVYSVPVNGGPVLRQGRLIKKILEWGKDSDVIYAQGADVVGLSSVLAGKLLGKKVIIKFVGDLSVEIVRDFKKSALTAKLIRLATRLSLFLADAIVFPASHLADSASHAYGIPRNKIEIIYNATAAPVGLKKPKKSGNLIISAGFSELLPVKNIAGVIKAFSIFARTYSPEPRTSELWIVGDGAERKNLEELSRNLGISRRVKFWGRVENQKAREILRMSDIFVLNSRHEGMPHALIEALAEGVPVVATRIPAATEILTDQETGIFTRVNNNKDSVVAIEKLVEDAKLRQSLARREKQLYEKMFTWENHLKSLEKIFPSLDA